MSEAAPYCVLLLSSQLTAANFVTLVLTVHLSVAVKGFWNTLLTVVTHPLVVPESKIVLIPSVSIAEALHLTYLQREPGGLVPQNLSSDPSPQSSSESQRHVFNTHRELSH